MCGVGVRIYVWDGRFVWNSIKAVIVVHIPSMQCMYTGYTHVFINCIARAAPTMLHVHDLCRLNARALYIRCRLHSSSLTCCV